MSSLAIRQFRGLRPRFGDQNLNEESATEAMNVDLDSGELRPVKSPMLFHTFSPSNASTAVVEKVTDEPVEQLELVVPIKIGEVCVAPQVQTAPVAIRRSASGEAARADPSFSVTLRPDTTEPVTYQWYVNGALSRGGVFKTFTLPKSSYRAKVDGDFALSSGGTSTFLSFLPVIIRISVVARNACGQVEADTYLELT